MVALPQHSPFEFAVSVLRSLDLLGGDSSFTLTQAAAPSLMPMHRAVEHDCWLFTNGANETFFLKVPSPDMRGFLDPSAARSAIAIAAEAGITPACLLFDERSGSFLFPWLGSGWRTAYIRDLGQASICEALIALKRRLHDGAAFVKSRTVFEHLIEMKALGDRLGITWSKDRQFLDAYARLIASAFDAAGHDMRPCHGDGLASNVMIGPDDALRLVDFDFACNDDPHHDLASLLLEISSEDARLAACIEMYNRRFDVRILNRVKLYMILDDLLWSSFSLISAQSSPRTQIEFQKYAEFRLVRCRYHLRIWSIEELLRGI